MVATFHNKIIIQCPADIASYWSAQPTIAPLFDGNNLILRIVANRYSTVSEGRKNVEYYKGLSSTVISTNTIFIGFRVQIIDSREDLKLLIRELANYSVGNGECTANPLTILDYQYRHDRADRDRGYRIRVGTFKGSIEKQGGTMTEGAIDCNTGIETITGGYRTTGFGFKFMETNPVGSF